MTGAKITFIPFQYFAKLSKFAFDEYGIWLTRLTYI